ncbi:MAG: GreA/GreB family elongation factor [Planctomycetes bacterium]|nr:GreA/GreB family elongation factor [Planctomycetota bacterium]
MTIELTESLLEAHRTGNLDRLEELWLELVEVLPADIQPLLGITDELIEWGERGRVQAMLEMMVPPLRDARRLHELFDVLTRLVKIDPEVEGLGPDFAACYQARHPDCDTVDLFIEKSRLRFARPIGPALQAMDQFLFFRSNDVVLHESGWGLGRVRGYDPLDAMLIVDFDAKKGHKVNPAAAPKLLRKLAPDDYRALKVLDAEGLARLVAGDPIGLLRQVLAARGRETTAARIKSDLVPDVVPAPAWNAWWNRARRAAEKDPMIRCAGSGAGMTFSLRDEPEQPAAETLQAYRSAASGARRVQIALDARRSVHAAHVVPALIEAIETTPAAGLVALAEQHFLLETLGVERPGKLDPAQLAEPGPALEVLTSLDHPHVRARAFEVIRSTPMSDRAGFLETAFFRVSEDLWDAVFEDLAGLGESGAAVRTHIMTELVRHPRHAPDRFGWLVNRALKGAITSPALPDAPSLLRKLIDAINDLHRNHAGEKGVRERVQRMQAVLTERDGALLDAVLDRCTGEEARGLRERFLTCLAFTENMKRELGVRVARRHAVQPAASHPDRRAAPAATDDAVLWTTEASLRARRGDYEKLVNDEIPRGQQALNQAASYGDLSENAEWTYALEQQAQLTRRAERMASELRRVRLIDPTAVPVDRMGLGSRGRFEDLVTGESLTFTILGPWDAAPDRGILSCESPLALQLLDRTVGSEFQVVLPQREMALRLLAIENALAPPAAN